MKFNFKIMSKTTTQIIEQQDLYTKSVQNLSNAVGTIKEKTPFETIMKADSFIFNAIKKLNN